MRALQRLHEAGWPAIVIGDVPAGTISPDSLAEVRIDDRERAMIDGVFAKLGDQIEAETCGLAFLYRASAFAPGEFEKMMRFPT